MPVEARSSPVRVALLLPQFQVDAAHELTAKHRVSTPVNWQQGEDVIIAGSVSNDEAKQIFGEWREPKPYIRIVPQPS